MTGYPSVSEARPPLPDVFRLAGEAMLITDPGQRILDVNPAFVALTGLGREALLGQSPDRLLVSAIEPGSGLFGVEPGDGAAVRRLEVTYRDARGRACQGLLSMAPVIDAERGLTHHVGVLTDLAALSGHRPPSARGSYFDVLTGLPNLQLLTQLIQESMRHVARRGGRLAVCSLDIDHFTRINDHLGEEAGDLLLSTFAYRIGHLLHGDDVLARIGGDEFALLLHRERGEPDLEALLEAIRRPLLVRGQALNVTASMGVAFYPGDEVAGEVLLRHATQAMYRAKQRGRNTYHIFDPALDRELQVRQAQRRRFAAALAGGELCLHYQPQVDMTSGRVIGLEALIRWQHPEQGLLAPGSFLPMIEATALEALLGEWVLERVLEQLRAWQARGIRLPVHVNISPAHLLAEDFTQRLAVLLGRYPEVPISRLKLEVLETAAVHDIQAALATMRHCQGLGIEFAIDDFGTGFSSLSNLRRLPVNLIKIDRSFVRDMLDDPDDLAIVESVVFMANRCGRPLLAEGVESLAHARALLGLGCTLAQGYGIARPMPAELLPAWLEAWPRRREWQALGGSEASATAIAPRPP